MKRNNKTDQFSFARNLRKEGKTNDLFETMVSNLKLEELIALKLELSAKPLRGKFFGFPIWNSTFHMVKHALLNFALSSAHSQREAANILGLSLAEFRKSLKQFNIRKENNHDN